MLSINNWNSHEREQAHERFRRTSKRAMAQSSAGDAASKSNIRISNWLDLEWRQLNSLCIRRLMLSCIVLPLLNGAYAANSAQHFRSNRITQSCLPAFLCPNWNAMPTTSSLHILDFCWAGCCTASERLLGETVDSSNAFFSNRSTSHVTHIIYSCHSIRKHFNSNIFQSINLSADRSFNTFLENATFFLLSACDARTANDCIVSTRYECAINVMRRVLTIRAN